MDTCSHEDELCTFREGIHRHGVSYLGGGGPKQGSPAARPGCANGRGHAVQAAKSTRDVENVEVQAANSSKEEDKVQGSNVTETSNTTKEVAQVAQAEEQSQTPLPAKSEAAKSEGNKFEESKGEEAQSEEAKIDEAKDGEASQAEVEATEASSHSDVEKVQQEVKEKAEDNQVAVAVKLFGDVNLSKRQGGEPRTFHAFGAFVGAATLATFALLLGSRRSRPSQGTHVLLDLERDIE